MALLNTQDLVKLAKIATGAKRSAPVAYSFQGEDFSYDDVQAALRAQFKEIAPDYRSYRENKNLIFRVLEETLTESIPERAKLNYEQWAEVKHFAQGDKPIFRRKTLNRNRTRGKQFVTRVGVAGIYEVFKLGSAQESFEVPTNAIGAAAQIGFEEFLDGRVDWSELINIIYEGMDDLIFEEVGKALSEGINQLPAANKVISNNFNEAAFDQILNQAKMYGNVTIYCTNEFAVKMIPQEAWRYTEAMKDELYRTGRLAGYKGENIVILPNQYKDAFGTEKVLDPSLCWIIPSGADQKPVKIAFEGEVYTNEFDNYDWSRDIHIYQKVGVVCMMDNAIHVYKDTSLSQSGAFMLKDTVKNTVTVDGEIITGSDVYVEKDMTGITDPAAAGLYEKTASGMVLTKDTTITANKKYYEKT